MPPRCEMLGWYHQPIFAYRGRHDHCSASAKKGYRTIRLPWPSPSMTVFHDRSMPGDQEFAGVCLNCFWGVSWGYVFFGYTEPSIKQPLLCRRILAWIRPVWSLRSPRLCDALHDGAYHVDHALFLRRFHALLGHRSCFWPRCVYWYRPEQVWSLQFSRHDRQNPEHPQGLVAKKHSWLKVSGFISPLPQRKTILGHLLLSAVQADLESVWRFCQRSSGDADYAPERQYHGGKPLKARKALFPQITVSVFPMRFSNCNRLTKRWATFAQVQSGCGGAYHAPSKRVFPSVCGANEWPRRHYPGRDEAHTLGVRETQSVQ
jgi:hypothetical protein